MDLTELRQKIDALDDSIRDAFLERMAICADIAAYKKENGLAVAHPGREREIVARLTKDMDADMATYFKIFRLAGCLKSRAPTKPRRPRM